MLLLKTWKVAAAALALLTTKRIAGRSKRRDRANAAVAALERSAELLAKARARARRKQSGAASRRRRRGSRRRPHAMFASVRPSTTEADLEDPRPLRRAHSIVTPRSVSADRGGAAGRDADIPRTWIFRGRPRTDEDPRPPTSERKSSLDGMGPRSPRIAAAPRGATRTFRGRPKCGRPPRRVAKAVARTPSAQATRGKSLDIETYGKAMEALMPAFSAYGRIFDNAARKDVQGNVDKLRRRGGRAALLCPSRGR